MVNSTNDKLQQILDAMAPTQSTALTLPLPHSPDTHTHMAIDSQTLFNQTKFTKSKKELDFQKEKVSQSSYLYDLLEIDQKLN